MPGPAGVGYRSRNKPSARKLSRSKKGTIARAVFYIDELLALSPVLKACSKNGKQEWLAEVIAIKESMPIAFVEGSRKLNDSRTK